MNYKKNKQKNLQRLVALSLAGTVLTSCNPYTASDKEKENSSITSEAETGDTVTNYEITIQKGDTLSSLANRYQTTVEDLMDLNDIDNPDMIQSGDTIIVPVELLDVAQTDYTVSVGDNLDVIAKKYGTTVDELLLLNPQITDADVIHIGDVIKVPESDTYSFSYKIQTGESLDSIASSFGCTVDELMDLNPNIDNRDYVRAGDTINVPLPENTESYIVQNGDTVSKICDRFDMDYNKFLQMNQIEDPNKITVGDRLLIISDEEIYPSVVAGESDTLDSLADQYNVFPEDMEIVNGTDEIESGDTVYLPDPTTPPVTEDELLESQKNETEYGPLVHTNIINDWNKSISNHGYVTGIDISLHQADMDLGAVLQSNPEIDFVYVRTFNFAAKGENADLYSNYYNHVQAAMDNDVALGFYYLPSCVDKETATKETNKVIDFLSDLQSQGIYFSMPIALDIENIPDCKTIINNIKNDNPDTIEAINTTINMLQDAGYYVMLYTGDSCINDYLSNYVAADGSIFGLDTWIARYGNLYENGGASVRISEDNLSTLGGKAPQYVSSYGIHQYTSNGYVSVYDNNIDLNRAYKNYPNIIYQHGLNHLDEYYLADQTEKNNQEDSNKHEKPNNSGNESSLYNTNDSNYLDEYFSNLNFESNDIYTEPPKVLCKR